MSHSWVRTRDRLAIAGNLQYTPGSRLFYAFVDSRVVLKGRINVNKPNASYPFPEHVGKLRVMIFVDGENLAIRYGKMLKGNKHPDHVTYCPDIYVWTDVLNVSHHKLCTVVRRNYYTSVKGDSPKREEVHDQLHELGIEVPRVFQKHKEKGSKQVDIMLARDMLVQAFRDSYDAAVLVAGDEDYVPLAEAISDQGKAFYLWFLEDGLSPLLRRSAHHYFDLRRAVLEPMPLELGYQYLP